MTPLIDHVSNNSSKSGSFYGINVWSNHGDIYLKQSYKNFDEILVTFFCLDCNGTMYNLIPTWELNFLFSHSRLFDICKMHHNYDIFSGVNLDGNNTHKCSTETLWYWAQNSNVEIIEIYGINY
jgi:hypothetical protein